MSDSTLLNSIFEKESELWLAASEKHPFLVGCADGTISKHQFDTWMAQDYLYVNSFQLFLKGVLVVAPTSDKMVLESGLNAVDKELEWFVLRAKERDLDLSAAPLPTTVTYRDFMSILANENYSVQVIALYLIERVYQKAWSVVLEKAGKDGIYSLYAQNWGNADFKSYVDMLEILASREMSTDNVNDAEIHNLFEKIMKLEVLFWDMAFESA